MARPRRRRRRNSAECNIHQFLYSEAIAAMVYCLPKLLAGVPGDNARRRWMMRWL